MVNMMIESAMGNYHVKAEHKFVNADGDIFTVVAGWYSCPAIRRQEQTVLS